MVQLLPMACLYYMSGSLFCAVVVSSLEHLVDSVLLLQIYIKMKQIILKNVIHIFVQHH